MVQADPFIRRARVLGVVDGDTIDVQIDVGFYLTAVQRLRLLGVNTPELHAADPVTRDLAQQARQLTTTWVLDHVHGVPDTGWPYTIRTEKADAFGRYLAVVMCREGHSLAQALLDAGNPIYKR